ncbi:phage portal protein, HK97 family [Micromonospora pallida]|uniref:Phage portal protein, HK97 family n=1 Tax=Micromonospora pallida TaxID=145854 RepID=A0A1C6TNM6_9ACTN|nr:phage portal protein [Micromonospora pallida]SCL43173.1 phage portal protein, HK97 family [Micromonospora pallida]
MSLWRRAASITSPQDLIGERRAARTNTTAVTNDSAMRHSAVWACLRLRADLLSTMPVDVYRRVQGVQVEVPKPPVLVNPGGERVDIQEWLYSSQVDLDRAGNCFGLVTERTALGLPARIDLVALSDVVVRAKGSTITEIRIAGTPYTGDRLADVWHEKQFTVAGLPLGLSPVAYAALSLQESASAQRFAVDWFGGSAIPMAELVNTAKTINKTEAQIAKDHYRAAVTSGDLFVHGKDWEYKPIQTVANDTQFLESRQFGLTDISRFFGCPADLIDAAVSTGSITYATITQRNLQFLIMNLGPAVTRRETALGRLVPGTRYVKLNRSALLAMDPQARAETIKTRLDSRQLTPSEGRALDDRPPLTDADLAEFAAVYGAPRTQPTEAKS